MSVTEMKNIIKAKVDTLPDDQVEKVFSKIIAAIETASGEKIELEKFIPGIFEKYDALMKKLA